MNDMDKINLLEMNREALLGFVLEMGEKSFRASQIWSWLYTKGAGQFDEMTNLSKAFREKLNRIAEIRHLHLIRISDSSTSGTQKFLWQLADGLQIESVFIPEEKRRTICVSSQVGCKLACGFCATGSMGYKRNLKAYEIIDQILSIRAKVEEPPTNVVVMGMGEPFLNYDNVIEALTLVNDKDSIAIGHRKITISTAGVVPAIHRYTEEGHPFKLAISLNATTDAVRSRIMPINRKYPIKMLLNAAKIYTKKSKKRITFEYVLLRGVNDSMEDANRLLSLLKKIPCKVNLIAYNSTQSDYSRPENVHIEAFAETIRPLCAPVTLRLSKGDDINGACGQLAGGMQELS